MSAPDEHTKLREELTGRWGRVGQLMGAMNPKQQEALSALRPSLVTVEMQASELVACIKQVCEDYAGSISGVTDGAVCAKVTKLIGQLQRLNAALILAERADVARAELALSTEVRQ